MSIGIMQLQSFFWYYCKTHHTHNDWTVIAMTTPTSITLTFLVVLGVVCPSEAGAEAEVGELDVSVQVDEDVVGLEVAVQDIGRVDVFSPLCVLGLREEIGRASCRERV